jgi:hypothetical protein
MRTVVPYLQKVPLSVGAGQNDRPDELGHPKVSIVHDLRKRPSAPEAGSATDRLHAHRG